MTTRLLAIPALNGWIHAGTVNGIVESVGLYHALTIHHGRASLSLVRDELVNNFLRSSFDELVMVDADVEFNRKEFQTFVETEGDLVAPTVIKRNSAESSHRYEQRSFTPTHFSCCAIKIRKSVLQKMIEHTPRVIAYPVGNEVFHNFFPCGVFDGEFLSEAYAFSHLARLAGADLVLAPVSFRHWGMAQF